MTTPAHPSGHPPAAPAPTARAAAAGSRPIHLRPANIVLVTAGGILGTLARYCMETAVPSPDGWPLPTLAINLAGAFLLGVLLEALIRRGPDAGRRRTIRLAAGTGFMGAFTTYSTLATEAVQLGTTNHLTGAVLYAVLSLAGGVLASTAGIWAASIHHRRTSGRRAGARGRGARGTGAGAAAETDR
ncbi:MAG: CrcB family protein [Actinomycetota bacterium]|nr:CrcB family protein [Actinomycetota bacterium]